MYVIKVKGKKKIPDYVQVRDNDFTLVGYFSIKPGNPMLRLEKLGLKGKEEEFRKFIDTIPFGKLRKLDL